MSSASFKTKCVICDRPDYNGKVAIFSVVGVGLIMDEINGCLEYEPNQGNLAEEMEGRIRFMG